MVYILARIAAFRKMIEQNKQELAELSGIVIEDNKGEVAMFSSFVQLDKAIPLLLDMRDDLKAVRNNNHKITQVLEEVRGIRENIQPEYAMNFRQMQN